VCGGFLRWWQGQWTLLPQEHEQRRQYQRQRRWYVASEISIALNALLLTRRQAFHLVATPSPPEPSTPEVPVIPTAPLLTSCEEIESPRNLLSNGGFEQIGKNGALPIAPWTSSKADDVYGYTYKPGAHCGERYM
jgi:hypothetical protein